MGAIPLSFKLRLYLCHSLLIMVEIMVRVRIRVRIRNWVKDWNRVGHRFRYGVAVRVK
jgi:hypothetical protein